VVGNEGVRSAWIAVAVLASLGVLAVARRGGWMRAGAWLVLGVAGQTAALALYEAGPRVSYHHYRPGGNPLALAAITVTLVAQAAAVAWGIRARLGELRAAVERLAGGWKAPAILLATILVATKPSEPALRSLVEFAFAATIHVLALGNLVLAALALPPDALARLDALLERLLGPRGRDGPEPGGPDRFAVGLALASFAVAALLNVTVYQRHPHVPDEVVYLLHARYLAAGKLWLEPPPVPAAFDLDLMLLDGGRWYSPVPIGWPLVLAAGTALGIPSLVNPLLGAASVLVAYAFLRELADRRTARIATLLIAASPWFVFLNMSYMTHAWTMLCAMVAALGVARSRRTGSIVACVVAGAAIGVVAWIRPLDGLLLALALGLWSMGLCGARLRIPAIAALIVATAGVGALTLPYNAALTGEPLRFPIQRYVDVVYGPGRNDMGFGPEKGLDWGGLDPWPGHSPSEALVTAQFNAFALDAELFGWCAGSLLFLWLWMVQARWSRADRAMLAFAALIAGSSLLYWFNGGPDFGPRYWYLAFVPCVWLTVSGLRAAEERAAEPARVRAFAAMLVAVAWCTWMPWRAIDKYWRYRGMLPALRGLEERAPGRSLVIVAGDRHPHFASAALENPLDLEADAPIVAWDADPRARARLLEHYSDRPVWIAWRQGWAGGVGWSGPMTADEARASLDERRR
jgi:hypothetical protein